MEDRKCEIVMLQEREKALYASFKASLGENNEFADFLTDIFTKDVEYMEEVRRKAGWRFCSFCFNGFLTHISMWSSICLSVYLEP